MDREWIEKVALLIPQSVVSDRDDSVGHADQLRVSSK